MKRLILVFFVLIFSIACNQNASKKGILTQDVMISILTDVHLVDGYLSNLPPNDSLKQVASNYYNLVYKKHSTDSTHFKRSLEYFSTKPVLLDTMYNQVIVNLEKMQKKEESRIERVRSQTDAYNSLKQQTHGTLFKAYDIWFFKFSTQSINYKISSKIFKADTIAKAGIVNKVKADPKAATLKKDTANIMRKLKRKSFEARRKFIMNLH